MHVDLADLSRAVGRDVSAYSVEEIDPHLRRHSVTGGVYRITGEEFSLVIKVVRNGEDADPDSLWVSGDEPEHRNYWKREWLAYCSGLLDALPGELRAPRTLLCTEPRANEAWIWMEDVEGVAGATWSIEDYDSVAFDLATTQAAYASGRSVLPTEPWLSRNWLRGWVDIIGKQIDTLDDDALWQEDWQQPLAALRPRIRDLWGAREDLLAIVASAPQTVVHLDLWPANLIAADDGTTVAIDWSQVGIGAIAQDLDQLTLDPVWMLVVPDAPLEVLESHVVPSYVSGLRLSGFDVDEVSVRRWYAAAAAIHYAPLAVFQASRQDAPAEIAAAEQRHGLPYAVIATHKTRVIDHALNLGETLLDGR